MSRSVYVNGSWRAYHQARIHIEDRGFQFADGVYETCAVRKGVVIDLQPHLSRLARSLAKLKMDWPVAQRAMPHLIHQTIERNHVRDGLVYIQITRGHAQRDHIFPLAAKPSLVIIARHLSNAARREGINVITTPDLRWQLCDIKSTSLLANVLARQKAREQNAQEAWLVNEQGIITEGAASNAWIFHGGRLITHAPDAAILNGITRLSVIEIARDLAIPIEETGFTRAQALAADEAFITSSVGGVTAVDRLDGQKIGIAEGAMTRRITRKMTHKIRAAFEEKILQQVKK